MTVHISDPGEWARIIAAIEIRLPRPEMYVSSDRQWFVGGTGITYLFLTAIS